MRLSQLTPAGDRKFAESAFIGMNPGLARSLHILNPLILVGLTGRG